MSRRFETLYRVKRRDNLGDPDYWNGRLDDIDRRIDSNETVLQNLDEVANRVEGAAFDRINNIVTPLVVETTTRLSSISNLFQSTALGTVTIISGPITLYVQEVDRATFAHLGYVRIMPPDDFSRGMIGPVTAYDKVTGEIDVNVELSWGSGTFSIWSMVASPPAEAHLTASQIGAATQTDINTAIAQLVGTATQASDTLGEIETINKAAAAASLALAIALG